VEPDFGQYVACLRLLKSMLLAVLKKYYLDSSLVDNMVVLYSGVFLCFYDNTTNFVTKFIVSIF